MRGWLIDELRNQQRWICRSSELWLVADSGRFKALAKQRFG